MRAMRSTALGLAAMLALAGCNSGGPDEAAQPEGLSIVATDYAFEVPDDVQGGIVEVTVDNQGEQTHEANFVRVADGYDTAEFATDFAAVIEGGPIPDTFETAVGITDAPAGEATTATITLPEGTWLLFCSLEDEGDDEGEEEGEGEGAVAEGAEEADADAAAADEGEAAAAEGEDDDTNAAMHFQKGMIAEFTVTGGADVTVEDMPETDGVIAAKDYGFDLPEFSAGEGTYTFTNSSDSQLHHLVLFGFAEGVDEAGAKAVFDQMMAAGEGPPPEGLTPPDEAGYTPVAGPGMANTFELELESGRTYAAVCFIQDRAGGPPHAMAHQMVEFFTVA